MAQNPDLELLRLLRDHSATGASVDTLARGLAIPASEVPRRIQTVVRQGFSIDETAPGHYRVAAGPAHLDVDDIRSRLSPQARMGRDIHVFRETTSTNDVCDRFARDGMCEGTVVFAESQTRGRGRLGRRWQTRPGSALCFSVLLRPAFDVSDVTRLTIAAATAVSRAVQSEAGVSVAIKWPNDILVRGRKLAGILLETHADHHAIRHAIVGIGLNVQQEARDWPVEIADLATSLRIECGRPLDRAGLAAACLREFEVDYADVADGRFERVADEWAGQCVTLGQQVTVQQGHRVLQGRAEVLDNDGSLLIRTQHGRLERVTGGDVTF